MTPVQGGASADDYRASMQQVLARNEFQHLTASRMPSWLKTSLNAVALQWQNFWKSVGSAVGNFFRWLGRLISRWFPRSIPRVKTPHEGYDWLANLGTFFRYLLWVLLLAAVIVLGGLLLSHLLAARRRRDAGVTAELTKPDAATRRKQEPTFWERSLGQAEELWQQGNQREAIRVLHRACLMLLDMRGVLRFDETRANGEVLRELRRQQGRLHDTLRPIMRSFDRSWYGYLSLSNEEFTQALEHSRNFRKAVVGGE